MVEKGKPASVQKDKLEKMLNIEIDKVEENDKIKIYVNRGKIGKAIGFAGANVRAAEKILGKEIEIVKE